MIDGPYFQAHLEGSREDLGFSTLQAAMNYIEENKNPTGEIYYIPDDAEPVAFLMLSYSEGDIKPGPGITNEALEEA